MTRQQKVGSSQKTWAEATENGKAQRASNKHRHLCIWVRQENQWDSKREPQKALAASQATRLNQLTIMSNNWVSSERHGRKGDTVVPKPSLCSPAPGKENPGLLRLKPTESTWAVSGVIQTHSHCAALIEIIDSWPRRSLFCSCPGRYRHEPAASIAPPHLHRGFEKPSCVSARKSSQNI